MTLSQLARALSRAAVYTRDVNAVKRGRTPERIVNRTAAKLLARSVRRFWL